MDYYLFTARSVTHAQGMAQALERSGIYVKIRRVGKELTKSGCGYTLQVPERRYVQAVDTLRVAGVRPIRIFFVSGGVMSEVTP